MATSRVGSSVTFEYVVTNPGTVPLSGVTVTDDNGTPADPADDFAPTFRNGDANGNSLLDPGESWTYSTTRVAAAGQFSHSGSVTAKPPGGGTNVVASDPEHQVGIVPTVLANISTRLRVETGDRVLIGGFIITGNEDKKVIVRALGPSVDVPGALANPTVEVYNSEGGLIAQNDNWLDAPNRQEIIDSTIPPTNDLESAFLGTLAPGAYTAVVSGVGETTGIGLVEVYDLDQTVDSDLGNIATRGSVQTGANVLIGGLIVTGNAQLQVLVRGIGPSLMVSGKLADPTLELVNANGDTLLANDNWRDTQENAIEATTIAPTNDLESAILTTVQPANYTAILRGRDGTTGIGVVEIYAVE
jgi:archaellum component FlaF (FlaF/FlaG flagellin family)